MGAKHGRKRGLGSFLADRVDQVYELTDEHVWGKTKDSEPAPSKAKSLADDRPVRGESTESSETDELRRSIVELTKKIEDLEKSRTPDET